MNRKIAITSAIIIIVAILSLSIVQLSQEPVVSLNTEMLQVQIMSLTGNQVTIKIENTGYEPVTVTSAMINNSTATIEPFTLEVNVEKTIILNGTFLNGDIYKVTFLTSHNAPFYDVTTANFS